MLLPPDPPPSLPVRSNKKVLCSGMRWTAVPRHRRASGLYVSRTSTRHAPLVGTRSPYIPGKGVSKLYPGDYELFWYVPGGKACAYLCRDGIQTYAERRYRPTSKGDTDPRRKETQTKTIARYRPRRSRGTDQRNLFDPMRLVRESVARKKYFVCCFFENI